jgi:hypothetical protein
MSNQAIISRYGTSKRHRHRKKNSQIPEISLRPRDIDSIIVVKVLTLLNSLNTPKEVKNAITMRAGERVLSIRIAQRIVNKREELGRFKDLEQVAAVPGIGIKKFNAIIYAFGDLT